MQTIQPEFRNKSKFLHNCGSGQQDTQGSKEKELGVKEEGTRSQMGVMKTEKMKAEKNRDTMVYEL